MTEAKRVARGPSENEARTTHAEPHATRANPRKLRGAAFPDKI